MAVNFRSKGQEETQSSGLSVSLNGPRSATHLHWLATVRAEELRAQAEKLAPEMQRHLPRTHPPPTFRISSIHAHE